MSVFCPACGSAELKTEKNGATLSTAFGELTKYEERLDCCLSCGERGDFAGENDAIIEKALELALKKSVVSMLDELSSKGIKMSYFERAMQLPSRTIARWKSGESSAASVALLRTIRAFPWILEVADSRFDQNVADMKIMNEAGNIWLNKILPHANRVAINKTINPNSIDFHAHFQFMNKELKPQIKRI